MNKAYGIKAFWVNAKNAKLIKQPFAVTSAFSTIKQILNSRSC